MKVKCPKDPEAQITAKTCIARQAMIAGEHRKNTFVNEQLCNVRDMCLGCETGLDLYRGQK